MPTSARAVGMATERMRATTIRRRTSAASFSRSSVNRYSEILLAAQRLVATTSR
jgi:hypothetical protein